MNLTRRDWLKLTGGAALAASLPRALADGSVPASTDFSAPPDIQPLVRSLKGARLYISPCAITRSANANL